MTSTSKAFKRLGVAGLVAATIGAGVPAFFASPASAATNTAPVDSITITPPADTAAVGTCNPYTVTVFANGTAADGRTVDAVVEEFQNNNGTATTADSTANGGTGPAGNTLNDPTTDVDFCTVATPSDGVGGAAQPATPQNTVDTGAAGGGDRAEYTTDANGKVVIGISSNNVTAARLTVFADQGSTPGGATNPGVNNNARDTGEPVAYATKQFTAGGANSVCEVDASPNTAGNFIGETHTVLVTAYNDADTATAGCQQGDPVTGITPSAFVETSTNVTHTGDQLTCGTTGNNGGQALCTYTEMTTGTDTIRVYVNNTTPATAPATRTPSNAYESGYEASDTVKKTWTTSSTADTIDLTCGTGAQTAANGGRTSAEDCINPTTQKTEAFTATVKDAAGVAAAGIIVRFTENGDKDVTITATPQGTAPSAASTPDTQECITDATGVCTATLKNTTPNSGQVVTVTATIRGQAATTANPASDSGTKTWKAAPDQARYIDAGPDQTVTSGQSATFTATVTDVNGDPVSGVVVDFKNNGSIGQFHGAFRTTTATTDASGKATVVVDTTAGEFGTTEIQATIDAAQQTDIDPTTNTTGASQCGQLKGAGNGATATTTAGVCTDSALLTVRAASPTPSPSPTSSSSGAPGTQNLTLTLDSPATIVPGVQSKMTARGSANADVTLRCYSRTPENSTPGSGTPPYFDARNANLGESGTIQFVLNPGTNTRCFVKYRNTADNASTVSPSVVQNVATNLSLSAYRDGVRQYHFQGTNLPRRAGQLITLYRYATGPNLDKYCVPARESYNRTSNSSCVAIRTATAVTNSSNVWRIDRKFTGSGQFYFVARTSQTLTNVAGFSNQRLTIIH